MFNLDEAEKLPDYELQYHGKTQTFDTVLVVSKLAKDLVGLSSPDQIRDKVNEIFGLAFNTSEALLVLHDFEQFADKFEVLLKKLFGQNQSSSTTTVLDPKNTDASLQENVLVSSQT